MPFSDPTDSYQLFKMEREDYTAWEELPEGYEFLRKWSRDEERELLQSEFPYWQIPYNREMPGMQEDSVVCVGVDGHVVALLYSSESETGEPDYGQIHYTVVHPVHRRHNLLAAMVTELFRRWPTYRGGYFHVDREGHKGMYERWGADYKGETPKSPPLPDPPKSTLARLRRRLGAVRRRVLDRS